MTLRNDFAKNFVRTSLFFVLVGVCLNSHAQSSDLAVRIIKPETSPMRLKSLPQSEKNLIPIMPPHFYHFGAARIGETQEVQHFTLEFAEGSKISQVVSTPDFTVQPGGSCVAGSFYSAGSSCDLLVRFTPQGPGHRMGKVTITHTQSTKPLVVGLLGYGYLPVVSFTPGVIATVSATISAGKGVINGARSLFVDGGDTLYVADTGNNIVRQMDSSGVLQTIAPSALTPVGVAVDNFGQVYYSEPASNLLFEIFDYGPVVQISGSGSDACTYAAPCSLSSEAVSKPGQLAIDPYNNLFFPNANQGAALSTVQPTPATFANLYDPFPYQETGIGAFGVDSSDNLYSLWSIPPNNCEIVEQPLYDAANFIGLFNKVAGGHACGFSGDGGRAGSAEIGASIGQMAFDIAGNLYFSDTSNNRVRRIDAYTGVIRTIAGNGTSGYTGDGGPATSATLAAATGVAVDSRGEVYILSSAPASGTLQVVRKVGVNGALTFSGTVQNTSSPALVVTLTNTGNTSLTFNKTLMTGANTADFTIDPVSTTCNFSAGNAIASG
jgi:hypothetical protein